MRPALVFLVISVLITFYLFYAALDRAPAPLANGRLAAGAGEQAPAPIQNRVVRIGVEGAELPACPAIVQSKRGTRVYWAPNEERLAKAELAAGTSLALCEATADDLWFGAVFAIAGGSLASCRVNRAVPSVREYQGPCRWGWIKGGSVTAD